MIEKTFYAITYTDGEGNLAMMSPKCEEIHIDAKPFYLSKDNAEKKVKNILRDIKDYQLERLQATINRIYKDKEERVLDGWWFKSQLKLLEDYELILERGLIIKEVKVVVE